MKGKGEWEGSEGEKEKNNIPPLLFILPIPFYNLSLSSLPLFFPLPLLNHKKGKRKNIKATNMGGGEVTK